MSSRIKIKEDDVQWTSSSRIEAINCTPHSALPNGVFIDLHNELIALLIYHPSYRK
ncbi:hypothetical protein [Alkalihalobacterium elongatum]|uniref:hypothetical protein n=1 Tax=Alkalihalobacterium elongatum TaxID=2675466 RepID=UPI001C1F6B02|nr:hypothetical protein [Alkalihalobacterium elongatum]